MDELLLEAGEEALGGGLVNRQIPVRPIDPSMFRDANAAAKSLLVYCAPRSEWKTQPDQTRQPRQRRVRPPDPHHRPRPGTPARFARLADRFPPRIVATRQVPFPIAGIVSSTTRFSLQDMASATNDTPSAQDCSRIWV